MAASSRNDAASPSHPSHNIHESRRGALALICLPGAAAALRAVDCGVILAALALTGLILMVPVSNSGTLLKPTGRYNGKIYSPFGVTTLYNDRFTTESLDDSNPISPLHSFPECYSSLVQSKNTPLRGSVMVSKADDD